MARSRNALHNALFPLCFGSRRIATKTEPVWFYRMHTNGFSPEKGLMLALLLPRKKWQKIALLLQTIGHYAKIRLGGSQQNYAKYSFEEKSI